MATIFDSVVRKENDHTNLLCAIMDRHPKVAASVLSCILGRDVYEVETARYTVRTQNTFNTDLGREIPDLIVEGGKFQCLVEVKIDPSLQLTPAQAAGYPGCFPASGERHLCFLVPRNWQHGHVLEDVRATAAEVGTDVRSCDWPRLIERLDKDLEGLDDQVIAEAIDFWKRSFEMIEMRQEEKAAIAAWSEHTYTAFRKLEKTVDQAKKLFDAKRKPTELETSDVEYGFYVKSGEKYVVWVGIWNVTEFPLSYGYRPNHPHWITPMNVGDLPPEKYKMHLWSFPSESWGNPQAVYDRVSEFVREHWEL